MINRREFAMLGGQEGIAKGIGLEATNPGV